MPSRTSQQPAHRPLEGIRAVEIGTSVAAPYGTWILAALGADVVKIERPGSGDDARQWGELFADGTSSMFEALNRDKRGIALDLKSPEQLAWLKNFATSEVDVVLQNLRPGHIARYGLDAESLRAANTALIYCNIWAFGQRGPLKDLPGYDPLMQAFGGIMSVTGETGRAPVRVGTSIIDMGTGMWCAIGILAALSRKAATGEGCVVDASLFETSLGWMTYHLTGLQASGENPSRRGSGAPGMAPYQAYRCEDGYLMIAAPNDNLFKKMCASLGHEEWAEQEAFSNNRQRHENLEALNAQIESVTTTGTRAHWQARLEANGIPCAPEQNTSEMMDHPQTEALGIVQNVAGSDLRLMGMPLSFDGTRPPLTRRAPKIGEHNTLITKDGDK